MINLRWVSTSVGMRKLVPLAGSTATELGLIGAVVLVATLGFWFFLGDALQYAFSFVRKDMVTQVSNANGLTPEAFVGQWKGTTSGNSQHILDPVQPTAPVVTAGSNGTEAHAEIYKALQALIDRSLQKGTMTEAQADLLSKLVKQILRVGELQEAQYDAINAYLKASENAREKGAGEIGVAEQAYYLAASDWPDEKAEEGYERGEEAYRSVLSRGTDPYNPSLDELCVTVAKRYTDFIKSSVTFTVNRDILENLYAAAEQSELLNDPEVNDFLKQVMAQAFS